MDVLVDLNRPEEAFHVLERSRARSLLAMLAERDLVFSADIPEELELQRRRTNADYDRTRATLGGLNPVKDADEVSRLLSRLRELRDAQVQIEKRVREASPLLASLQYPRPLTLAEVRRTLDPGTVLLSYSVGRERSVLFVVRPDFGGTGRDGASAFVISEGEEALTREVEAFRDLIQQTPEPGNRPWVAAARRLFGRLMGPARRAIASSERVLVCPDGPLHMLPFAALMEGERYLVEAKPIHLVASATLEAQLNARRPPRGDRPLRLVAFGDPVYPKLAREAADEIASPEVRLEVLRGRRFEPLPGTRREVEGIAALFGEGASAFLGADATEGRAKHVGSEARYLHFACHGLLNARFPLDSALALTIPERPAEDQDNGLLQAWEIFERVRLEADLVTLSACQSGLGKEMGGEGLLGLTRAFQYARARSVLASLWGVSDESTAELMRRFYGYLKQGKPKNEALRAAQINFIRGPAGSSEPFRWAAFQLYGDWR